MDSVTAYAPADALPPLPGGGELGQLIRDKDWSATPLGPMAEWPQSLRTAVSIVVYSRFPMIVLWGPEHIQVYNDAYRLLMGTKHPAGLGMPNRECWPEVWQINKGIYPRVLAGETVGFETARYPLAPYGKVEDFYLTLSYSPVIGESGRPEGIFVTVFDVTKEVRTREERDQALTAARAERQRLYEVFMQAPAAIAVLEGPEHVFTVANSRYRKLVGGREVIGRKVDDALPEVREQGFVELLDKVRLTGEPFVAQDAKVRLDRTGHGEFEDVYVDFVYQPLKSAAGEVYGIMAHAVETTQQVIARKRIEELAADHARLQLRAERDRRQLYEVFQQAPAAIALLTGREHTVATTNPLFCQLVGVSRDMQGQPIRDALPEFEGQGFFELLDQVFETKTPFFGREMLARYDRDGDGKPEDAYFNFVYQPVTDETGAAVATMIHAVEVTEQVLARKDVERQADELSRLTYALERSNRDLDQFAYVASHDLKAPLRGLANLSQWIEEDLGDRLTSESRQHLDLMKGRVHRMEALIDGILMYSRAGRVRGAVETIDTGKLVREVIELLSPPDGVVVDVQPEMPVVESERVPLQQVFMNLIGNAIKYSRPVREDVRVEVRWQHGREGPQFSIRDNGPGIASQYHERIWGIFQTLQARDKVEGTGIGLSVVKKIIESRGGHVWLQSAPGEGSTFHFTWPRGVARPATEDRK
jgi:signal transduction histidine kinase